MAPQGVIDLLSTDDEKAVLPNLPEKKAVKTAVRRQTHHPSGSDLVDIDGFTTDDWNESAPKRRRPSKSPPTQSDVTARPPAQSKSIALTTTGYIRGGSNFSDDIIFTSSVGAGISKDALRPFKQAPDDASGDESDDDFPDDILSLSNPNLGSGLSDKTRSFLAKIKTDQTSVPRAKRGVRGPTATRSISKTTSLSIEATQDIIASDDEHQTIQPPRPKAMRKPKLTEEEKAAKAQEKEASREIRLAQKSKDKEVEKEKKRVEREEKTREKQRIADLLEVNKAKTGKKETCMEMIVDLPISIEGSRVDDQIKEFLKNQQITAASYQSSVPNVIRWRRKVDSYFDEEQGHRVAMPKKIRDEKHALCLMGAKDFVELATADPNQHGSDTLDGHIRKLKTSFAGCTVIYIIEGLDAWMRKNKNARNRAYQAAVLKQAEDSGTASSSQHNPRRKQPDPLIDEDMIEDALLRLQIIEGCLVHHTATPFESAQWVANFTLHISQIPYKQDRMRLDTSFCMDSGQVKTGDDKDDTYIKMLQEVNLVTVSMAHGIAAKYPNVSKLLDGFKDHGPLALEDIRKLANRDGALSDRRIGPAASRRLHAIFMGTDPSSTNV
ncbi:MAG: hypothetical protein Q9195_007054 [Heterodermia aff. obscurata]